MKILPFATLLCALCVALPGRAAASQSAATTAPRTLASAASAPASSRDAWNAPPMTPLTRAQVYRELVRAQRDGQLAQLNRALYSH
ncbi:hypothetical protein WS75_06165 [Burkholderia sp. FL-7-2-10-S1-D7]|uniref:DUF4148 domain-containing protein n=1 Tax=Burkholderia sp. FL-7-2-10-S1-D7 TaxID=1637866 RepID=UPI0007594AB7|nr:DUF4148 domain-containing protein [Burkholderia sp. FL-7-2-10-S1-D7]KVF78857.1 hypothetical protein WS75_06165 [Burkholderia sp. FL-7-2-10-S1-D7]